MKNLKIITTFFVLLSFLACDKDDAAFNNIYDNDGQTGVGFTATTASIAIKAEGASITLSVQATTTSDAARSYNVSVNEELSDGNPGDYTIGSITIPAGSYNGELALSFVDTNLAEMVAYTLVVELDLPDGVATVGSKSAKISYNKYLICNDFTLVMNEDAYANERSWEVTDSGGDVVVSGGGYSYMAGGQQIVENFYLDDGCYTFTIYDAFSDGQYDGVITGGYSLTCSIINLASGEGNWGGADATDFCVNP